MRLYLSSFRFGSHPEILIEFSGKRSVAVISNALDFIPNDARRAYERNVYSPHEDFASLGLNSVDLDLRDYFGKPEALQRELKDFGLVWVMGGNAFLLMRALQQSAFPELIRDMLNRDEIAYGGFSAGAVVAAQTLRGIEIMDDPAQLAEGYHPEPCWRGLGLVDFSIVPHYRSEHPEAEAAEAAVAYMIENKMNFRAMADGEIFLSRSGVAEFLPKEVLVSQ
jgi:dipeptidase E